MPTKEEVSKIVEEIRAIRLVDMEPKYQEVKVRISEKRILKYNSEVIRYSDTPGDWIVKKILKAIRNGETEVTID